MLCLKPRNLETLVALSKTTNSCKLCFLRLDPTIYTNLMVIPTTSRSYTPLALECSFQLQNNTKQIDMKVSYNVKLRYAPIVAIVLGGKYLEFT